MTDPVSFTIRGAAYTIEIPCEEGQTRSLFLPDGRRAFVQVLSMSKLKPYGRMALRSANVSALKLAGVPQEIARHATFDMDVDSAIEAWKAGRPIPIPKKARRNWKGTKNGIVSIEGSGGQRLRMLMVAELMRMGVPRKDASRISLNQSVESFYEDWSRRQTEDGHE